MTSSLINDHCYDADIRAMTQLLHKWVELKIFGSHKNYFYMNSWVVICVTGSLYHLVVWVCAVCLNKAFKSC